MITQNFDVRAGVVNGAVGTLERIRFRVDGDGQRHATSCIVAIPDMSGDALPHVGAGRAVALRDSVDLQFRHPFSRKKLQIKRKQVPIMPAFAITAHKAQGRTLSSAIVDLDSCRGTESPYVMISKVKSLNGLLILRPFKIGVIQKRQSEEYRTESKWLRILTMMTLQTHGNDSEKKQATGASRSLM